MPLFTNRISRRQDALAGSDNFESATATMRQIGPECPEMSRPIRGAFFEMSQTGTSGLAGAKFSTFPTFSEQSSTSPNREPKQIRISILALAHSSDQIAMQNQKSKMHSILWELIKLGVGTKLKKVSPTNKWFGTAATACIGSLSPFYLPDRNCGPFPVSPRK